MIENFLLSLGSRHNVEPRYLTIQTQQKVCVWCVFHIFCGLDGTLCLQPMAGQSVWSECERSRAKVLAKRITLKLLNTRLVIKALRAATSLTVIG